MPAGSNSEERSRHRDLIVASASAAGISVLLLIALAVPEVAAWRREVGLDSKILALIFAGAVPPLAASMWLSRRRMARLCTALERVSDSQDNQSRILESFEALLSQAPGPIFLQDSNGRLLLVNKRFQAWYGLSAKDAIGRPAGEALPAGFAEAQGALAAQVLETGETVQGQIPLRRPDGALCQLLCTSYPVLGPEGGTVAVGTIATDVTVCAAAQEQLQQSKLDLELRIGEMDDLQQRLESEAGKAVEMAEELHETRTLLSDAVESISEGFALWDQDNCLIMQNQPHIDMFKDVEDVLQPGVFFGDFIRASLERGVAAYDPEIGLDATVEAILAGHRAPSGPFEHAFSGGRWFRISERQTKSGRVVSILTDITEQKNTEATIERMALEDALTGLPNRAQFHNKLTDAIENSKRINRMVGVMLLDLDHFKKVNDTLGHPAGDELLRQVSARIKDCLRTTDSVARLGGDEFAVIITNVQELEGITLVAERIVESIGEPFLLEGNEVHSGTSVGITVFPLDRGSSDQLLRNADLALYRAKEEGRGTYQIYDAKMHEEVQARRILEDDLRRALDRDELYLVYQPQFDCETGEMIGAEALLRWNHPRRGAVPPSEFIPVAEATRQIIPISEWILEKVCRQIRSWQDVGLPEIRVSVNISPLHFKQGRLAEQIGFALSKSGLSAELLELEITESVAMGEGQDTKRVLTDLKKLGLKLAIDDFGTGYSSLNRLKQFPVDRLKIDRSFVQDITTDWDDAAINSAVIQIGHSLNIKVIAEGVETRDQFQFLVDHGCNEAQGYLFSPPLPAEAFARFTKSHDPERITSMLSRPSRAFLAIDQTDSAGTKTGDAPGTEERRGGLTS